MLQQRDKVFKNVFLEFKSRSLEREYEKLITNRFLGVQKYVLLRKNGVCLFTPSGLHWVKRYYVKYARYAHVVCDDAPRLY